MSAKTSVLFGLGGGALTLLLLLAVGTFWQPLPFSTGPGGRTLDERTQTTNQEIQKLRLEIDALYEKREALLAEQQQLKDELARLRTRF